MEPFLHNVASYLYKKYGSSLSDCALVFPNRRASLFFTGYLSEIIEKPVWLPRMVTISDLIQEVSGLQPADPITLNFELYRVFQMVSKSKESFDEFYGWGEIMLADFDEIDKYYANADSLFRNVTELKNLQEKFDYLTPDQIEAIKSFWSSFRPGNPSPQQKDFLWLWEALSQIYGEFRKSLTKSGIAYEGMIFRQVAEGISSGTISFRGHDNYFFAGFNALNECEKVIFDHLKKENRAEFFWDHDEYYMAPGHQAGYFMRENLKRYPHGGFAQENRKSGIEKVEIEVIAASSKSGQAKLLSNLSHMFDGQDPVKTAVVLSDESLLLPVLSSMPSFVKEINVTMGYPLKATPLYGLVMHLISLQKNSKTDESGSMLFHNRDVVSLLRHPDFISGNSAVAGGLISGIMNEKMIFVNESFLNGTEQGRLIFKKAGSGASFIGYILEILEYLAEKQVQNDDDEDKPGNEGFPVREFIYSLHSGAGRLRDILANSDTDMKFDTLVKLIRKVLQGMRIPFFGEPLGGVQVMGVLETRAVDFENVIWLSMNDGIFPAGGQRSSFIPYSLRKAYGLPRDEQHDAVYAYYFYRLMQRTRKMTLVYNTATDGLTAGEMSRFIYQLKFDKNFSVNEKNLVFNLLPSAHKPVCIDKTAGISDMLKKYTGNEKYLSPGAINTYIDCSLKFYFRYIAKIPEPENISGEIDPALFGNLVHKAAQLMYAPFTGKQVSAHDVDLLLKEKGRLEQYVAEAFNQVVFTNGHDAGKRLSGINRIVSGVIAKYLRQLLAYDRRFVPFEIEALEKFYPGKITVDINGRPEVSIGGIIDRVDTAGGAKRVVDYKTGGDEPDFKSVASLFDREEPKRRKAVFQTFMYAWLYSHNSGYGIHVAPVLYPVKKFSGNQPMIISEKIGRTEKKEVFDFNDYKVEYEENLRLVLADLLGPEKGFEQTGVTAVCKYCSYKKLCRR
jgi:hypothetical protein